MVATRYRNNSISFLDLFNALLTVHTVENAELEAGNVEWSIPSRITAA